MNSSIPAICASDNSNPDISGIGVRVSFYLQTFLLVLLVNRSWADAPNALWTLTATSFGLTIAAIVQASKDSLSLFQAIEVSILVWQSNFASYLALASYSRSKEKDEIEMKGPDDSSNYSMPRRILEDAMRPDVQAKLGAVLQIYFSAGLTIYMWAVAPTFGTDANKCNALVTLMLFRIPVQAISSGRVIGLTITIILTIVYMIITVHELSVYAAWQARRSKASVPRNKRRNSLPNKDHWQCSSVDGSFVVIVVFQSLTTAYFVVSSELILAWNDPNDGANNQWAFGQILALIVVVPSALSLVNALYKHGIKSLDKEIPDPKLAPVPSPGHVESHALEAVR